MNSKVGLEKNGYQIFVMHFPYRKKPCLGIKLPNENAYYKVASFNSEETAEWFVKHMEKCFFNKE